MSLLFTIIAGVVAIVAPPPLQLARLGVYGVFIYLQTSAPKKVFRPVFVLAFAATFSSSLCRLFVSGTATLGSLADP